MHGVYSNVSFGYAPDTLVLEAFSLEAKPGQSIALVGPTGADKTTIISLLTRFYDCTSGTIPIDGHVIRIRASSGVRNWRSGPHRILARRFWQPLVILASYE